MSEFNQGKSVQIQPPIFVRKKSGAVFALSTVGELIEFLRRSDERQDWARLREAAFVAAAVPSEENVATLRRLADEAFEGRV